MVGVRIRGSLWAAAVLQILAVSACSPAPQPAQEVRQPSAPPAPAVALSAAVAQPEEALLLLGTILRSAPGESTAVVKVGQAEPRVVKVGDQLSPGAAVDQIGADFLKVRSATTVRTVATATAPPAAGPALVSTAPASAPAPQRKADQEAGFQRSLAASRVILQGHE